MRKNTVCDAAVFISILFAGACAPAQTPASPSPKMAPIEQYLMDRDAEIALARTAAPDAISHDASVVVLTRYHHTSRLGHQPLQLRWPSKDQLTRESVF